jgi:hypothetical protein
VNSPARFSIIFTPPAPIQITTNATCFGSSQGSILITQSNSLIWHYEINNSLGTTVASGICINDSLLISDLYGGNYLLIASGAGINDTISFNIYEYPPVAANFSTEVNFGSSMAQVEYTNTSQGTASFFWDLGDGTISNSFSPVHQYSSSGTYFISLTAIDSFGCTSIATDTITIPSYISLEINDKQTDFKFNVFQSQGNLQLQLLNEQQADVIINVFNYSGQIIYSYSNRNVQSYSEMIPVPSSGTYITHAIINNKLISKQVSIIK